MRAEVAVYKRNCHDCHFLNAVKKNKNNNKAIQTNIVKKAGTSSKQSDCMNRSAERV